MYKKTEKLATALYMVTNLFGESEPMKWTLRKKVGDMLSFMIAYKDISDYADFSNSIQTRVLEIVSLLEVCMRSGLVSSMNFSVLKKEFSNLLAVLADAAKVPRSASGYTVLPHALFDVPNIPMQSPVSTPSLHPDPDTSSTRFHTISHIKDTPSIPAAVTGEFKKTNRQNIIINMLKKKKDLTIKDIAQVIRDCSEKTIQRELIDLISNGIIVKTGERRWSRYSLKTQ